MRSTTDYGMFKTVPGNRGTVKAHVSKLAQAIDEKNLLAEFPLLVNERMEIVDGQHRLAAAASLGVPVFYQIVPTLGLDNVMAINTASKSWSLEDFINSYIEQGLKDYVELKEFATTHHLGYSMSASMLLGRGGSRGGSTSGVIKSGRFVVNARIRAGAVAGAVTRSRPYADFNIGADRDYVWAVWILMDNEDFSVDRLIGKFETHGLKITKRVSTRYYLLQLEEVYNFNAKDKVTLYAGQA